MSNIPCHHFCPSCGVPLQPESLQLDPEDIPRIVLEVQRRLMEQARRNRKEEDD